MLYANIGEIAKILGDIPRAYSFLSEALALETAARGEGTSRVAYLWNNLADVHLLMGQPVRAKELAERGLALRRSISGERKESIARSLQTLASAEHALGNPGAAIYLHDQATELLGASLAGDPVERALDRCSRLVLVAQMEKTKEAVDAVHAALLALPEESARCTALAIGLS